jgi:tripartite-type tricarboxylate transporter receptor subunit TctC
MGGGGGGIGLHRLMKQRWNEPAKTIQFATTEISLMMNAGILFEKTKKIKGVKSLLCNRYTI